MSNSGGGFFVLGSWASSYLNKTAISNFRDKIPFINVLPPHFIALFMVKSMYIQSITAITA